MRQSEYEAVTEDRCAYCGNRYQLTRISDKPEYACPPCFSKHYGLQYAPSHPEADADGYVRAGRFLKTAPEVSHERAREFLQKMHEVSRGEINGGIRPGHEGVGRPTEPVPAMHEEVMGSEERAQGVQNHGRDTEPG